MTYRLVTWRTFAILCCAVLVLATIKTWWSLDDPDVRRPGVDRWKLPYHPTVVKQSRGTTIAKHDVHLANNITAFQLSLLSGNVMAERTNKQTSSKAREVRSACVVEPLLECSNIGFAAMLLITMEQISYCHNTLGSTPSVIWRNCHAVCSKNPHFNSWNWYFEPVNPTIEFAAKKVVCVAMVSPEAGRPVWLDASFRERGLPEFDERNAFITSKTRREANDIIQRYIKPSENITRVVEELYITHLHGNNLLGIHVRGTDHISESKGHRLAPIKMWIEEASLILASIPAPSKIFIAADNSEVLVTFRKEFGRNKVFFTRALRAKSYRQKEAPHTFTDMLDIDPQRFGSEVLIDILLLAKCQDFLHAESSVSTLATLFNPEMKSYFLGELSSKLNNIAQSQKPVDKEPRNSSEAITGHLQDTEFDPGSYEDQANEITDCFVKNSPASTCPKMAAGKFISPSEVRTFLAGQSDLSKYKNNSL